jgi:phospholipid/cholesterol/gamma-HCH transport system ATP-binding protein
MILNNIKKTFKIRPEQTEVATKAITELEVLKSISVNITSGKICGLIGPSAGGKSVLLKIMAGVLESDQGEISYENNNADLKIGLMFQEGALFDSLNAFENVAFPLISGNLPVSSRSKSEQAQIRDQVAWILDRVGLAKAYNKVPGQLSGGMRKRLALARALVSRPELVLLDDPTSGLDPVASAVIMKLITQIHGDYKPTTIIVSHDLRRLIPVCDQLVALFSGEIVYQGNPAELLSAPEYVKNFINCRYDLN